MSAKLRDKSLYGLLILLVLGLVHSLPLWNLRENVAGGYGDPLAHAAIGGWYCSRVLTGQPHSDQFMAPTGVDLSANYDSPFPFALTCPFVNSGSLFQFHLFTLLQILLIILASWLVATRFLKGSLLQTAYILFVWWCGFYISRSHQHVTLLSMIWATQFVLYALLNLRVLSLKNILAAGLLLGLGFTGSFQNIPALFLLTFTLIAYKFWADRKEWLQKQSLLNLFLGLTLASVIFFGLWAPMIAFNLKNGLISTDSQRLFYNLDLLSPFIPFESSILYTWWPSLIKLSLERSNSFDPWVIALVLISVLRKKFWKDPLRILLLANALVYFILSLGPELRWGNEVLAYLDFNTELFRHFPLNITRTPGRLALITNLCFIFLAFLFLNEWQNPRTKKYLSVALISWSILSGPIMNRMWFFPTINYTQLLPMEALTVLRNMPQDHIVVQIPSAWAQDPTQNFNQLFHTKNITAGYLSYISYNKEVIANFSKDPFLGRLGCEGEFTAFAGNALLGSANALHQHLITHKYRGIIINKQILVNNPACKNLKAWITEFIKLPWVKPLEENNYFFIAEIQ